MPCYAAFRFTVCINILPFLTHCHGGTHSGGISRAARQYTHMVVNNTKCVTCKCKYLRRSQDVGIWTGLTVEFWWNSSRFATIHWQKITNFHQTLTISLYSIHYISSHSVNYILLNIIQLLCLMEICNLLSITCTFCISINMCRIWFNGLCDMCYASFCNTSPFF